jgi:hypothetical protein
MVTRRNEWSDPMQVFLNRFSVLVLAVSTFVSSQAQTSTTDMKTLVGRKAIAQRIPFWKPGTYEMIPLKYAGKTVTIVNVQPSTMYAGMPTMTPEQLAAMPEAMRQSMEGLKTASIVTVQFADGTKADTGALPVTALTLSSFLKLLPDDANNTPSDSANSSSIPASGAPAQAPTASSIPLISATEVRAAIQGEGKNHWVNLMAGGEGSPQITPKIAYIELLMPEAILAEKSASARSQFLPYDPKEEDEQHALTIFAYGGAGETIQDGCISITRVVRLSSETGGIVKEAFVSDSAAETWRNGFGASNQCDSIWTKFTFEDVSAVKAAAKDGEFYVAVFSGSVKLKVYKVKKKHQTKLSLQ